MNIYFTVFRALKAGCKKPLFVRPVDDNFVGFAGKVATLGALHALYVVGSFISNGTTVI